MKKLLLFAALALCFSTIHAQLPDLNGYWEGTNFSENSSNPETFNCGIYQDGNGVHAISIDSEENFAFGGSIDSDTLRGELIMAGSDPIHVRVYSSNDSVVYKYQTEDYLVYGRGYLERISDCATLIIDYSYLGSLINVSENYAIGIDIYNSESILETYPIISVNKYEASGIAYIPGILTEPVFCAISTGYNDSVRTFYDLSMPYTTYGSDPENFQVDAISIAQGSSQTISLTFDDSYLYHLDSYFPGGKMGYLGSHELSFTPKYITQHDNKFYIINNTNNEVQVYSETFEYENTLEDNMGDPIFAHAIQFDEDGSFYACNNANLNQFSSTGELLASTPISAIEDADIEIASQSIYFSNRNEITKLSKDLSSTHITLTKSDIQNDYPPYSSQDFHIRDIAFDANNKFAIAIDANPDDEGKDMIIFYDEGLTNIVDTITGYWIMNNPICVDFDENNYCYVTSYWHDNLAVHAPDKTMFSATFWKDEPGMTNGAMNAPADHIVVDGKAYVIERNNNRVSIFELSTLVSTNNIHNPQNKICKIYPVPSNGATNISINLSAPQPVSISAYDINGRLVEKILVKKNLAKGIHNFEWKNDNLKGMYFIVIDAKTFTETNRVIKM